MIERKNAANDMCQKCGGTAMNHDPERGHVCINCSWASEMDAMRREAMDRMAKNPTAGRPLKYDRLVGKKEPAVRETPSRKLFGERGTGKFYIMPGGEIGCREI